MRGTTKDYSNDSYDTEEYNYNYSLGIFCCFFHEKSDNKYCYLEFYFDGRLLEDHSGVYRTSTKKLEMVLNYNCLKFGEKVPLDSYL